MLYYGFCQPAKVAADYRHGTGHGVGAALHVHEIPPYIGQRFDATLALDYGMLRGSSQRIIHLEVLAPALIQENRDPLQAGLFVTCHLLAAFFKNLPASVGPPRRGKVLQEPTQTIQAAGGQVVQANRLIQVRRRWRRGQANAYPKPLLYLTHLQPKPKTRLVKQKDCRNIYRDRSTSVAWSRQRCHWVKNAPRSHWRIPFKEMLSRI